MSFSIQRDWLRRRARRQMMRAEASEWLDQGRGTPADVAANLAEMGRINRWLGGYGALTRHLWPRLLAAARAGGYARPVTVLDLGTGGAGLPLVIQRWAEAHAVPVQVWALDNSRRNLAVAKAIREVSLLQADAAALPLAPGSVDYVISSLFVHHFAPAEVVALLRAAYTAARGGVVMSDLARGYLPLAAFRLVQPVFARHPLTRHDGALSIRRAYTRVELADLAAAAGLPRARVYAHWPWRLTLVADHGRAPATRHG